MAKDVDAAVRAAQLYIGCGNKVNIRDAQRLYDQMRKKIENVARRYKMDSSSAYEQIMTRAKTKGGICPILGKDI